jgi:hypothetical protein
MKKNFLLLLLVGLISTSCSDNHQTNSQTIVPTKHNKNLTLSQIAEIQSGLGIVMVEFGHRFHIIYYSAKAKNWDLAHYELYELIEAQEIAETTRPQYAKEVKAFEDKYLKPLNRAIESKNWNDFSKQYKQTTKGCNVCHVKTGHPYIQYKLPKTPPLFPSMELE